MFGDFLFGLGFWALLIFCGFIGYKINNSAGCVCGIIAGLILGSFIVTFFKRDTWNDNTME